MSPTDPERQHRLEEAAEDLYSLVADLASWKIREDGLVYADEPLEDYIKAARQLVDYINGRA